MLVAVNTILYYGLNRLLLCPVVCLRNTNNVEATGVMRTVSIVCVCFGEVVKTGVMWVYVGDKIIALAVLLGLRIVIVRAYLPDIDSLIPKRGIS